MLDRALVKDFLIYIRAFEEKNYDILNKVKCNFFSASKIRASTDLLQEDYKHNSISDTSVKPGHRKQKSMDCASSKMIILKQENFKSSSVENEIKLNSDQIKPISNSEKAKSDNAHSLNSSLLELRISELNAKPKNINGHRRMHSFPNIQVNLQKKNSMLAANNK